MKKVIFFLLIILASFTFTSCEGVPSGHSAALVEFGGKTQMDQIYGEGLHTGISYLWNDLVSYDVREKTITHKYEFNDKNNMKTPVEISIDYKLDGTKVNIIHSTIGKEQLDAKITTTLSSAAKQVIPQYSASELNLSKRDEAETQILIILQKEFPEFYVNCSRTRITDVDIPEAIAAAAESTAKQAELNKLSESKVADAKNRLDAAKFDAEAKAILSKPEMLALKKLEVEMQWAIKGVSPYGNNNVFGSETSIVRLLK